MLGFVKESDLPC